MNKPEYATNEIGHIMSECWRADPSQRMTFRQLEEALGNQLDPALVTKFIQLNESCTTAKTTQNNYQIK